MDVKRQKIQLELALASELTGEAPKLERRGTAASMAGPVPESPAGEGQLCLNPCLTCRTAVYGPVRTVVWEGWGREASPYPDGWSAAIPINGGWSAVEP